MKENSQTCATIGPKRALIWGSAFEANSELVGGTAIAQWIRLWLQSCRPGFESQAHQLHFIQFIKVQIVYLLLELSVKRPKKNKKGRDWSYLKQQLWQQVSRDLAVDYLVFASW